MIDPNSAEQKATAAQRRRQRELAMLYDAERAALSEIESLGRALTKHTMLYLYDVGVTVTELSLSPELRDDALHKIHKLLHNPNLIYAPMEIAKWMSRERLAVLADRTASDGSYLTWYDLVLMLPIDDLDVREQVLERFFIEGLTVKELVKIVDELTKPQPLGRIKK
jgi:hypothetical protein